MTLTLGSQGHQELMKQLEALYNHLRLDREDRSLWQGGHLYCDGTVNNLFLAFRQGAAYGITAQRLEP
jgi:hypothetical protein